MNNNKNSIKIACNVIRLYLNKIKMGTRRKLILTKLLESTLEKQDKENIFPIKLSTQELYTTSSQKSKDISGWYTGIKEQIKKDKEILIQIARENKCQYFFTIDKDKGERGQNSFYYITAIPIPSKKYSIPKGAIEYVADEIQIPFLVRWFDGFTINGWKRWLFSIVILFAVSTIGLSLFLMNPMYYKTAYHWLQGVFFFSVLSATVYYIFRPFQLAIDYRIVKAPWIFLPLNIIDGQLESSWDDNNNRFFRIIVYKAKCPVCGSRIDIRNGEEKHSQRMIGRCRLSPVEHIFSFDPETKIGFPLNSELTKILDNQN